MVQDLKTMIFHFSILNIKHLDNYNVSMQHLEESYSFSKIDYKVFHPSLIRDNDHIELHQKIIVISQLIYQLN